MIDWLLYLITAVLYALLGLRDLQLQFGSGQAADGRRDDMPGVESQSERQVHRLLPLAWITHVLLLQHTLFAGGHFDLSLGHAISLIGAFTVMVYWLSSRHTSLGILRPAILCIAALATIAPLVLHSAKIVNLERGLAFQLHILASFLAYSLFIIAALHAGLMAIQERRLHAGEVRGRLGHLPSLVAMDTLLFQLVLSGFVLLTLTLASGILFSEEVFGRPFTLSHKTLLGVISWAIFGGLLIGRWGYGWRGRRAALWTITGFVVLALAYVGQKMVLEIILHRV